MYKNFLFDLDGTLLPMDIKKFVELYVSSICVKMCSKIYVDPKTFTDALWKGMGAMAKNNTGMLNSEVFWDTASMVCGKEMRGYAELFEDYYRNEFAAVKDSVSATPYAKMCVDFIRQNGGRVIIATNPVFPSAATNRRLEWAGLNPGDFELITVYDNSYSCKPNLGYYQSILERLELHPEESIMVGNDVDEDMCAAELGIDTFLVTDCLINRSEKDLSPFRKGSLKDFYDFLIPEHV